MAGVSLGGADGSSWRGATELLRRRRRDVGGDRCPNDPNDLAGARAADIELQEARAVAITDELRAHRESLVVRHIQAETDNDAETALQTFTRPMYDLRGTSGGIVEGTDAVRELIAGFGTSLPSVAYVADTVHHADNAVIVEYRITGSHDA